MPQPGRCLTRLKPHQGEHESGTRFSRDPIGEFGYYGGAFLRSAQVLRRSLRRRSGHFQSDILPLLYLYRHAIELLAKATILAGNELASVRGRGKTSQEILAVFARSGHTLPPLVAGIREAFTEAGWEWHWPNTTVETWADFEEVMADLASLDPASVSFRYPVSPKGQSTAVEGFGLASTVATLDHLAEALDTAVFGMSAEASRESSPP